MGRTRSKSCSLIKAYKSNTMKTKQVKKVKDLSPTYKELVALANKSRDPLENLPAYKSFTSADGKQLFISCQRASDMPSSTLDWAFSLTEVNMKKLYEDAGWGWNPKEKKDELCHKKAWHLIVCDCDNVPKGFAHFRFVVDYGKPVVYCYELQVDTCAQRQGIGKQLMNLLNLIAAEFHMKKVVLTVLKSNVNAWNFYTKCLNFKIDETSPSKFGEDCCYEILSKAL